MAGKIDDERLRLDSCSRYPQCPRSTVSVAFYETLLRAGDDGFTKLPASFRLTEEKMIVPPADYVPLNEPLIVRAIELSKQSEALPKSGLSPFGSVAPPSRLLVFLAGLSASDRAQIAAVMLIGRGDEAADDFDDVVREWTRPLDWSQSEYLAGKKRLWKFLETGLEALEGSVSY
jgi:hypothetical protein